MRRYVLTTCENKRQVNYKICISEEFKTCCSWLPLAYATQLPIFDNVMDSDAYRLNVQNRHVI